MKHLYLIALFLWSLSVNGQVNAYMDDFRLSGHSDFETEQELLAQSESLLPQLLPFLQDSLSQVRQKAYYLIYRKGLQLPSAARDPFVMTLLQGCNDEMVKLLGYFEFREVRKGKTSGSRVKFMNPDGLPIMLHKPHPSGIMKQYQLKQVKEVLGL